MKILVGEYFKYSFASDWVIFKRFDEEQAIVIEASRAETPGRKIKINEVFLGLSEHLPNYEKELDTKKDVEELIK